jgi:menaquinone-dependent protoporphyrinogen oxidase
MPNTLIAYASKYGSTGEIAEYIGQVLREAGDRVEVRRVQDVDDLSPYQSVIIGSATRMDKVLPDVLKFGQKHQAALRQLKTAYFVVGVTMKQDTPENRQKAEGFLTPLCQIKEPVSMGLFAGKLDYKKIGFFWRLLASKDKTGFMAEGDFRDWETIRAWALEVHSLIKNLNE